MRSFRRYKKPVVQLTSLLDLLFVMIFVSLMQTKVSPTKAEPIPVPEKTVVAEAPQILESKPIPQPKRIPLSASFSFYPSVNSPGIPSGEFKMEGVFDERNGKLQLGGVSWVKRPQDYDMVPLVGEINQDRNLFTGKIEFPGCEEFTLRRTSVLSGSPLAGAWVGTYTCSQGSTGLTLKIE
jgi:hypothetical protein